MCREQLSRGFKTSKGLRREDDKSGDEAAVLPMAHARPMPAGAPGGLAALLSTCWGSCLGAGGLGGGGSPRAAPAPQPSLLGPRFISQLRVFVPPHALKLPEEPITRWGEYWCDVTVSEWPFSTHLSIPFPAGRVPPHPRYPWHLSNPHTPSPPPVGLPRQPSAPHVRARETRRCLSSSMGWEERKYFI